jgi:hypothetical protein
VGCGGPSRRARAGAALVASATTTLFAVTDHHYSGQQWCCALCWLLAQACASAGAATPFGGEPWVFRVYLWVCRQLGDVLLAY